MRIITENDDGSEKRVYENVTQYVVGGTMISTQGDLPLFRGSVVGDSHTMIGICFSLIEDLREYKRSVMNPDEADGNASCCYKCNTPVSQDVLGKRFTEKTDVQCVFVDSYTCCQCGSSNDVEVKLGRRFVLSEPRRHPPIKEVANAHGSILPGPHSSSLIEERGADGNDTG